MKITLNKKVLNIDADRFLRRNGYAFIVDRKMNKQSYVRRLGNGFYPRLHMYIEDYADKIIFDVHLDQKQASYEGARMHNAEHEGPVVEEEIIRLKNLLRLEHNS